MNDGFLTFLQLARWTSALVALAYHLRFLLLVNYDAVPDKNALLTGFYFLTGLGHESYAVFFVVDGILAGLILHRRRTRATAAGPGMGQHLGALYRIVLPGLLLGALFDATGSHYLGHTGVYTAFPEFSTLTLTVAAFVGNALMLQPWIVPDFGGNSMLYLAGCLAVLVLRAAGRLLARGRAGQGGWAHRPGRAGGGGAGRDAVFLPDLVPHLAGRRRPRLPGRSAQLAPAPGAGPGRVRRHPAVVPPARPAHRAHRAADARLADPVRLHGGRPRFRRDRLGAVSETGAARAGAPGGGRRRERGGLVGTGRRLHLLFPLPRDHAARGGRRGPVGPAAETAARPGGLRLVRLPRRRLRGHGGHRHLGGETAHETGRIRRWRACCGRTCSTCTGRRRRGWSAPARRRTATGAASGA